jgi:hypothetical protein
MGHLRLGRLPKTRRWLEVIKLLDVAHEDLTGIAAGVVNASDARLKTLESDPSLGYCFWLLTRISWAAHQPDFQQTLLNIGIPVDNKTSVLTFISRLIERVHVETDGNIQSGHFGEISSLALRWTLSEALIQHSGTLFGNNVENLRMALRAYSRPNQFARLSRKFFAEFFARTICSLVDRELSHHVGRDQLLKTSADSGAFMNALKIHSHDSALIMEKFAADWYSKHNWEAKGEVSIDEAQSFVAVALLKLRSEFKLGAVDK